VFASPLSLAISRAGVRKHARKTHLSWLKSVDETAGSRDRHLESKPSTYCVKEEGPFDDSYDVSPECSPGLTPQMGVLSMGGMMGGPPMMELPGPAMMPAGNARGLSGAMAAAAAASLVGQGPPPPLAWLLAHQNMLSQQQQGMAGMSGMPQHLPLGGQPPPPHQMTQQQQQQQAVSQQLAAAHFAAASAPYLAHAVPPPQLPPQASTPLPTIGTAMPRLPSYPQWMASLNDPLTHAPPVSLSVPVPASMPSPGGMGLDPLPPAGNWSSTDLAALFGAHAGDAPAEPASATGGSGEGSSVPLGPLGLTPPSAASVLSAACVSPFELEKRPKPPGVAQANEKAPFACAPAIAEGSENDLAEDVLKDMKEVRLPLASPPSCLSRRWADRPSPHLHPPLSSSFLYPCRPTMRRSLRRSWPSDEKAVLELDVHFRMRG
jgi:hypothetical protein